MVHLADWIVAAVAGPILVLCCLGAFAASIRTRANRSRIEEMEKDVSKFADALITLTTLVGDFKRIDERCMRRCETDLEFRKRNDSAHDRIELHIEKARDERVAQMTSLKEDLIREFRKGNGHQ